MLKMILDKKIINHAQSSGLLSGYNLYKILCLGKTNP